MERGGYRGRGRGRGGRDGDNAGYRGGGRDGDSAGYRGGGGRDGGNAGYRGGGGRDGGNAGYRGGGGRDGDNAGYRGGGGRDGDSAGYRGGGGRDGDNAGYRGGGGRDGDNAGYRGGGGSDGDNTGYRGRGGRDGRYGAPYCGGRTLSQPQWQQSRLQRPPQRRDPDPVPEYGNPSAPVSPWTGPVSPAVRAPSPRPQPHIQPQSPPVRFASAVQHLPDIQKLKISTPVASSSSSDNATRCTPIKRPDRGGTVSIRNVNLQVNHFPVKFNPESIIRHYDIDVKPVVDATQGRPVKLSKTHLTIIRNKFCKDNPGQFPLSMTAYDGEKNIFSAMELPTGKFNVDFPEGEDMKYRTYTFSIQLVNELKLCKLKDYLTGNLFSIPRDILQGMDVVMKENPTQRMISVGRSFHPAVPDENDDLRNGLTASRGFQHGLKATSQGLALCLDYSVLAFRKRLPVIQFLEEHVVGFNANRFRDWRAVDDALKSLKVTVTHRQTKQKFTIAGLTRETTRHLSFTLTDVEGRDPPKNVKLVDYFREKYGKDIMYTDIPCLELGKNNRKNHVPMEFCVLVEGQIYPKENLDRKTGIILKNLSLATPGVRQKEISKMIRSRDAPCGGEIARNFGINVNTNMTNVVGRVLGPPALNLGAPGGQVKRTTVDRDKCQWSLVGDRAVVEGKRIDRWAIVDFSASDRNHYLMRDQFIGGFMARCKKLGMDMKAPVLCESSSMYLFSNIVGLHELLEGITSRAYKISKGHLQILVCVMSRKDSGYKYLKWISETKVGVVTQCCLSIHANNLKNQDQYFANLALKINAKLGGSNAELSDRLPCFAVEDHVMFVGADVNHPGARNTTSPSIAAVVATVNWPAANRYIARVRPQNHRSEKILNFSDMCVELVKSYAQTNKVWPTKIVVFRDGVSEGQFDMVLNEELRPLQMAFRSMDYFPTITLIVAQKRHQTRLFPMDGTHRSANVPPGTVVDTNIVHPFEFDFYLCSHYGTLGTSKPTHYHVLWDEHGFTSDQLQKLIYNMCFTFARCTKPVSLVPPVYYADLVAYRGRLYHEAVVEGQSPASVSSTSSSLTSTSLSLEASFDESFYKLHADLENIMYFV